VIARYRALAELVLAGAALAGAGLSWSSAHRTVGVAPIADGQPYTASLVYDPQLLLLTLLLVTTAGVLAVIGLARLRRGRRARPSS
jgi:NO-binding membrane sensor protein with MHYT domain